MEVSAGQCILIIMQPYFTVLFPLHILGSLVFTVSSICIFILLLWRWLVCVWKCGLAKRYYCIWMSVGLSVSQCWGTYGFLITSQTHSDRAQIKKKTVVLLLANVANLLFLHNIASVLNVCKNILLLIYNYIGI